MYIEKYYVEDKVKKEYKCDYAALIARDLFLACDSAGWFWIHKTRKGNNLNYFADRGIYAFGTLTWLIHGGDETILTRLKLYRFLRDNIFDYSNKCIEKTNLVIEQKPEKIMYMRKKLLEYD